MSRIPEDKDLEEKIRNLQRWEKRLDFISALGWIFWAVPAMIAVIVYSALNIEMPTYLTPFLLGIGVVVIIASWTFSHKEMKEYPVNDSEWIQFYTSLIFNNLQMYFANKNSIGMSRKYRKKALYAARNFLSCIEKRWIIGRFDLVSYVGYLVSQIRNDIRYRIVPALDKENDAVLSRLAQVMYNLYHSSKPLSIETLRLLNEQMSSKEETKLPSYEPPGLETLFSRFLAFFRKPTVERHAVVIWISFNVCFFFGYLAWYGGIQKEYALTAALALFIFILTIYFQGKLFRRNS